MFQLIAALITVTTAFAWANHRWLRLPANIALLVMGLCASLLLIGVNAFFPNVSVYGTLASAIRRIDFYKALMHGMLAFLLFAGALNVDFNHLRSRARAVGALATFGVLISTAIVGVGLWAVSAVVGHPIAFAWALVFGALIAPTDPVAVLSSLKAVDVPKSLETDMSGEALFNDGIGVVLFTVLLDAAMHSAGGFGPAEVLRLLAIEAFGGALLGAATGFVAYRAMRAIDDYSIEVMISLALVMATYAIGIEIHVSGPIAVVVAGVLIGNRGPTHAMSKRTQQYFFGFWTLLDDILNAVLFLLIGLEVLVLGFDRSLFPIALIVIPLVVIARFAAVSGPVWLLRRWQPFTPGTIPILTWGAVRGGISVALALSLPHVAARPLILAATYSVVLFTVIVQGLSLARVIKWAAPAIAGGASSSEARHDGAERDET